MPNRLVVVAPERGEGLGGTSGAHDGGEGGGLRGGDGGGRM